MFQFTIRKAEVKDSQAIQQLMQPYSELSLYSEFCCSILIEHYQETTFVAVHKDEVVGFVMAHPDPHDESTIFLWQAIVAARYKGLGVCTQLLNELTQSDKITHLKALVNVEATACYRSLHKFAKKHHMEISKERYAPNPTMNLKKTGVDEVLWTLSKRKVEPLHLQVQYDRKKSPSLEVA